MPFTHFHLGPAVLLGLLFLKKIDFPTFLAANVIMDWRAALVFLGFWPGPRHGWVHTYIGATVMAILLGAVMIYARPLIDGELREMKIVQKISNKKIFLSAFLGTFLHVTIDSFHHPTMKPFMPLDFNPLLGLFSTAELRTALFFCLLLSFPLYIYHVQDRIDLSA